jgi:hypothetical protein
VERYLEDGYLLGYRPNPLFDTRWYLKRYEDVRRSGMNPLIHYLLHGFREGRDPGPDFQTAYYLGSNPDVRNNGVNPLTHYLRHGRHEGRLRVPCSGFDDPLDIRPHPCRQLGLGSGPIQTTGKQRPHAYLRQITLEKVQSR